MPFKHGKNTAVWLGGADISSWLDQASLGAEADVAETTTFGTTWKTGAPGALSSSAAFSGYYDPSQGALFTLVTSGASGQVLTFCPGGATAIGDRARLMSVSESTYGETAPVGGLVAMKFSTIADGPIGFGDVLHPAGEDTNTTTGAEKDDAASSATGWIAHLHVFAVDGGSWVIKLQDAAVSNTYTDLSGGAFTAATTATAQRLTGASGATLRRYVRYVATRTGGSAGDGITFALAYSRS